MPVGPRRKKMGQAGKGPSSQIKTGSSSGGGPDTYDGRANTNAGTPPEKKLEVEGPGRVVRTH